MFKRLALHNFKNFRRTSLEFGPLTTLVGTNASGKSNLRDALRFLNGIGLEYPLADIFGGSERGEGGWDGLRGGTEGAAYGKKREFKLNAEFDLEWDGERRSVRYVIGVNTGGEVPRGGFLDIAPPRIFREGLYLDEDCVFDTRSSRPAHESLREIGANVRLYGSDRWYSLPNDRSLLQQLVDEREVDFSVRDLARSVLGSLASMRFLDLDPAAMRESSIPGQKRLRDDGGNLAGVLYDLVQSEQHDGRRARDLKKTLLSWLEELTPMDARDIRFRPAEEGRVALVLVEGDGRETPASNASDGTLRFLGLLAALYGREKPKLLFLEEPETGLHPARLHLVVNLVEQRVRQGGPQVVISSHSPQLLRMLSPASLEASRLVYRPESRAGTGARLIPLLEIPDARRVVETQDVARLFESGWFEDMAGFQDRAPDESPAAEDEGDR